MSWPPGEGLTSRRWTGHHSLHVVEVVALIPSHAIDHWLAGPALLALEPQPKSLLVSVIHVVMSWHHCDAVIMSR